MTAPIGTEAISILLANKTAQAWEIAHWVRMGIDEVYEALVWLEARGFAALRPDNGRYAWASGVDRYRPAQNFSSMQEAA